MIGYRLVALIQLSRPKLFVMDLLIFATPFALVAARDERAITGGEVWLPLLIFVLARISATLFDAYHDADADAAAGAAQFASFKRLGPRTTIILAYAGCAVCFALGFHL